MADDLLKTISACDDLRIKGLITQDWAGLDKLFAEDMVYVHTTAKLDTKAEYLTALKSGYAKFKTGKRTETKVTSFGDVAILTGVVYMETVVGGEDRVLHGRVVNAWRKKGDGYQMISQTTVLIPKT